MKAKDCDFTFFISIHAMSVTEGGNSRNNALDKYLIEDECKRYLIKRRTLIEKITSAIKLWRLVLSLKGEKIFMSYSAATSLVALSRLAFNALSAKAIARGIEILSMNNELVVEVNDLPYEQFRDLKLGFINHQILDDKVFSLKNVHFVFAASRMRDYAAKRYGIPIDNTSVLINGGPPIKPTSIRDITELKVFPIVSSRLRFIYAGTLDEGRQIREMVDIFKGSKHNLILCGEGGGWLSRDIMGHKNIKLLGPLRESEAHAIVSLCDCGLIPYDSSLFYWQIAFPIKASFYATAGKPFISTPIPELLESFGPRALFYPLVEWPELLEDESLKKRISDIEVDSSINSANYTWEYICKQWMTERSCKPEVKIN